MRVRQALAAHNVSSVHLTWWTRRVELGQPREVLRFVLDRAVRLAGGMTVLPAAQQTCVHAARSWLEREYPHRPEDRSHANGVHF